MKGLLNPILPVLMLGLVAAPIYGKPSDKNIVSRTADIDGVKLHYLTALHGPTVTLLRFCGNFPHVATDHPGAGGEIHHDRTGSAGHW